MKDALGSTPVQAQSRGLETGERGAKHEEPFKLPGIQRKVTAVIMEDDSGEPFLVGDSSRVAG